MKTFCAALFPSAARLACLLICMPLCANVQAMAPIATEWSRADIGKLKRLYLAETLQPPPDPSNRVADDALAAAFGRAIFFDKRFSANGEFSCASCHQPEKDFTDGRARSKGMVPTLRNAPTVISAANYKWYYWDGRRDSLWSQALIPFEAADEMGSSRVSVLKIVIADAVYREQYRTIFGPLPAGEWIAALPDRAGPFGDLATRTAWYRIDNSQRAQINTFYANIGKSVAAFERSLRHEPTRFDRYASALIARAEDN
ncbi:MAG: cytochrome-c peroxidase, partial [Pseudomonadales bacterium]